MWDLLGLEPTTDKVLIRRAYLKCLKTIDVDLEPGRFMALREAFEGAVAWADDPSEPEVEDPDPEGLDAERAETEGAEAEETQTEPIDAWWERLDWRPSEPEHPLRQALAGLTGGARADLGLKSDEVQLFLDFQGAEERLDGREAEAIFNTIMARGLIDLGSEPEMGRRLVATASHDLDFPVERLRALVARLLPDRTGDFEHWREQTRALARGRLEAEDWFARMSDCADQPRIQGKPARQARRLARLLLKHRRRPRVAKVSIEELERGLGECAGHSAWLGPRLASAWIARLQRKLKVRKFWDLIWGWFCAALVVFLIANLIYQTGRSLITGEWN